MSYEETYIEILSNERNDSVGWRFSDGNGQVFSAGKFRHPNGIWSVEDELSLANPADAIDFLTESDFEQLLIALGERETSDRQRELLAREFVDKKIEVIKEAGYDGIRILCNDGRKRHFIQRGPDIFVAFYKQGGYRQWMLPLYGDDLRGLLEGTHEVRYIKRSNRGRVVRKKKN